MTPPPRPAPSHVPTLTEVIEIPEAVSPAEAPVVQDVRAEPFVEVSAVSVAPPSPTPVAVVPLSPPVPVPPVPQPLVASALPPVGAAQASLPVPPAPRLNAGVDEAAMAQRVLSEVQRQIDGMLEYRLREALTPILARTSESLVRELRQELSKTMRDVVSRAVAQEVARQRTRS